MLASIAAGVVVSRWVTRRCFVQRRLDAIEAGHRIAKRTPKAVRRPARQGCQQQIGRRIVAECERGATHSLPASCRIDVFLRGPANR